MVQIKDNIFWTGYIDWDLRNFHGYSTPRGSTYNAYLILDEKPTLIDSVKSYGSKEMLSRIKEVIDPSKIEYIISNHTEMDHSGAIDELLHLCPKAKVVCSPKGEEGLRRHFKKDWPFQVVQTGDVLNIGKRDLKFILMPMVHWPDSMATYSEHDKILFPNDAFGQHYASNERFADELDLNVMFKEAEKYYGNIVLPYGAQVLKVLDMIAPLDVEMICPSHGLMWRRKEDIEGMVAYYQKWARHETDEKVMIVYDTMWHSTEIMAQRLLALLKEEGIEVTLINLQDTVISDVITEVVSTKFLLFGSPILNNRMLPTMAGLLMYLKGLKPQKRYAWTFGSYGWSTSGFKEMEEFLKEGGCDILGEGVYLKYIPDESELEELRKVIPLVKDKLEKD